MQNELSSTSFLIEQLGLEFICSTKKSLSLFQEKLRAMKFIKQCNRKFSERSNQYDQIIKFPFSFWADHPVPLRNRK